MRQASVLIAGAGPAGLAAALSLGRDAVVLEHQAEAGGLCRTIEIDGATFDLGGHSFHTPHPDVRALVFSALEMYEQPRQARCWYDGQLISYPFQSHYGEIADPAVVAECARGADGARQTPAADFEQYLLARFGNGIARHFLLPYNRKLWGPNLVRLGADWAQERVASVKPQPGQTSWSDGRRRPLRADTVVAYPAAGGFGEIYRALARQVSDLRFNQSIASIDPARGRLTTADRVRYQWEHLVSTLPLPELVSRLTRCPAWLRSDVSCLEAVALALVLVVVDGPVDTAVQRIYCAGAECPAHKIVINHNSSPSLRARSRHGVLAEVSLTGTGATTDLSGSVVPGLRTMGVLRSLQDVRSTRVLKIQRAYPLPTHDRAGIVNRAKRWLAQHRIHTVGRFGEWAYINSDEALHRGLTIGAQLRGAEAKREVS